MQTISFLAIPKYKNSGLKTEVFYQVSGEVSERNPLNVFCKDMEKSKFYTPGKGRKLPKWFPDFAIKNAKKISNELYISMGLQYFEQKPAVRDFVVLRNKDLIERYSELKQQKQLGCDYELFEEECCKLSLEQKMLDLVDYTKEASFISDYYEQLFCNNKDSHKLVKRYLDRSIRHKQMAILLMQHKLGMLEYEPMKKITSSWSGNECDWFRIMSGAKSVNHIFQVGPELATDYSVYSFGERAATQRDDMSAERIIFLMQRVQCFLPTDYDMYLQCA